MNSVSSFKNLFKVLHRGLLLSLPGFLFLSSSAVQAAQCGGIPLTQAIFAGDQLVIDKDFSINGIDVVDGTFNTNQGLDTSGVVAQETYSLPDLEPAVSPTNQGTNTLTFTSSMTEYEIDIPYYQRGLKVFDRVDALLIGSGPLYARDSRLQYESSLSLGSANLFVESFKFGQNTELKITTGRTYIYVSDLLSIDKNSQINASGNPEDLIIYLYDGAEVKIDKDVTFNGIIYSPGDVDVTIGKNSVFHGLIATRGKIKVDKDATWTLSTDELDFINTISTCFDDNSFGSIGQWRLDEDSWSGLEADVLNSEKYILHGTAYGGITPVEGKVCNAALASSNGDYIEVVDDAGLLSRDLYFSITAWLNPSSLPGSGERNILGKGENYWLTLDSDGKVNFHWLDIDDGSHVLQSNNAIVIDNWTHVAVTFSGNLEQQKIYLNGTLDAESAIAKRAKTDSSEFRIGAGESILLNTFQGKIDEVGFYANTLTATSVKNIKEDTRACDGLEPYAWFKLDEASGTLTGTPGEFIDEQGNANTAYATGAGVDTVAAKICNGLSIPDVVQQLDAIGMNTGLDVDADIGNAGSIAFWYKANKDWTNGNFFGRNLFDASNYLFSYPLPYAENKYFSLRLRYWGQLEFVLKDNNLNPYIVSARQFYVANEWVHIAVSWDTSSDIRLYINGNLVDQTDFESNAVLEDLTTLLVGDNATRYSLYQIEGSADGVIDELMIFRRQLSDSEIDQLVTDISPCDEVLEYFVVTPLVQDGSTCVATEVDITAYNNDDQVMTDYTDSIVINTSSGHGNWSVVDGDGFLSPAVDSNDDGQVTYTFAASDNGYVRLALKNSHADDLYATVTDQQIGIVSQSTNFNFSDNAFVIEWSDSLGEQAIAGRDHGFTITAWEKDDSVGSCQVATVYDGDFPLKVWMNRQNLSLNSDDPGGLAPNINGVSLPDSTPSDSNLTLTFSSGVASGQLSTSDVGHYSISFLDDARVFANNTDILGDSPQLLVKPFGLSITEIKSASNVDNPENSGSGGSVFSSAATPFSAKLSGVLWSAADDSDDDGIIDAGQSFNDNSVAPAYAWAGQFAMLSGSGFTPNFSGAVQGSFSGGSISSGDFISGTAAASDLKYTEVGSFTLYATAINYLDEASADLSSDQIVVGRFNPKQFAVIDSDAGSWENVCAAGAFSYIGQSFGYASEPSMTIEAQNAEGNLTNNYTGAWAKLSDTSLSRTLLNNTGVTLDTNSINAMSLSDLGQDTGSNYGRHQFSWNSTDALAFARSELTPFAGDLDFIIANVDDGEVASSINQTLQPTQNQNLYGRLAMDNVHGSELFALDMLVSTQYLTASGNYETNSLDVGCTSPSDFIVPANPISLDTANSTNLSQIGTLPGGFFYQFSAPGSGNGGYADITTNLSSLPWLTYDWNGDGSQDNPQARVTFGIFQGNEVQIYQREVLR